MSEIKVTVNGYGDRNLVLRWTDPATGERKAKSAGTRNRAAAEREAALLEKELQENDFTIPGRMSWQDFTWAYTDQVFPGLAEKTQSKALSTFNTVEKYCKPKRLSDITSRRLTRLAQRLRDKGRSEATIKSHLAHLKAALNWAVKEKYIRKLPDFPAVQRAKGSKVMKGRPISGEEFDRMIDATEGIVGEKAAESWRRLLWGLWWSGLRLGEALNMTWDRRHTIRVDFGGRRPMLSIPAECQKSGRRQLHPMAPEFAQFLAETPEGDRHGRVFRLGAIVNPRGGRTGKGDITDVNYVGKVIGRIGAAAGVVIDRKTKRVEEKVEKKIKGKIRKVPTGRMVDKEVTQFASAHDLRRSFGFRWSRRIHPAELRELMRHSSLDTTMRYYVGHDAEATADALWEAVGNTFGNNGQNGNNQPEQENEKTPAKQGLS